MLEVVELSSFYKNLDQSDQGNDSECGHFNIFKIEDLVLPKYRKASYTRRSFYKITLVSGQSMIHYTDRDIEVDGSAIVFTNPSIQYHWETISERQTGYMCIFTDTFFRKFGNIKDYSVFQSKDEAVLPLLPEQVLTYESLFEKMCTELEGNYKFKYDLLQCLLMEVIHEAQKTVPLMESPLSNSNAAERIATTFTELMERQFPIELTYQVIKFNSPAAFAAQLNIHVNHLNKALKAIKGFTTSQLINERILQEAKILLKGTNWTIAQIAFSLGFGEANHFSAFFKSMAKITAKTYRKLSKD
ncbi:AraC family transcriptional regulator [Pedobacter frigidisoli]|uniref:AraC family transcriptional regulator n=1 Tax=Pedobacter frigidisoli TaxID=2530455 RepID=A0A4V2MMP7_9SPHI|nr:helix-turn-helix domain-containing protein [Pedobacter frigidisoli]TCD07656.1 AraC family transcriptional regulator [Pedobacter frigidisoli]